MKFKNDYIEVKSGNKKTIIKNTILDEYLNLFAKANIESINRKLQYCALKFDSKLDFDENSSISSLEFDVFLISSSFTENVTSSSNIIQYIFTSDTCHNSSGSVDIANYKDKKIYAIGFSDAYGSENNILAVVDTSNYDIRVNTSISVTRKDILKTDLEFKSDNFDYPLHLSLESAISYNDYYLVDANIIAIGFSNNKDTIKERIEIENTSIENGTLTIEDLCNYNSYATTYLSRILPFQLTRSAYKYIFYIYEVTGYKSDLTTVHSLGEYYEIGKCNLYGEVDAKIKYERG